MVPLPDVRPTQPLPEPTRCSQTSQSPASIWLADLFTSLAEKTVALSTHSKGQRVMSNNQDWDEPTFW